MARRRSRPARDDGLHAVVIGWSPEAASWRVLFRGTRSAYLDWFTPFSLRMRPDDPPFAVGRCGPHESDEAVAARLLRLPPPPDGEPGQLVTRLSPAPVH